MRAARKIDLLGNGFRLDGINDYIRLSSIPSSCRFQPNDGFTIAVYFWCDNDSSSIQTIFDTRNNTNGLHGYMLTNFGGEYTFLFHAGVTTNSISLKGIKVVGGYNSIIIKKESGSRLASSVKIFYNNILTNPTIEYNNLPNSTINYSVMDIGSTQYTGIGRYFKGILYDFKIFNTALSDDAVSKLYKSMHSTVDVNYVTNLVLNYDFNQTSGNILIDRVNSANSTILNATINGATNQWVDYRQNSLR